MADWLETTLFWVIQVIILIGLVGLIIPIFPGLVVIWLATLVYGVATGFTSLGWGMFALITILMIFGSLADNIFMGAGARKGGADWKTIGIALLGGLAGTLIFPPFGGLIVLPLAVFALEFWRQREWKKAGKAVGGLAIGWGVTYLVKLGIGIVMMMGWWVWVWKG